MPPKKKNRCPQHHPPLPPEQRVAYGVPSTKWGTLLRKWHFKDPAAFTKEQLDEAVSRQLSLAHHPLPLLTLDVVVITKNFEGTGHQDVIDAGCVPLLLGFIKNHATGVLDFDKHGSDEGSTLLRMVVAVVRRIVLRRDQVVFDEGGLEILCNLAAGTFDSKLFVLACDVVYILACEIDDARKSLPQSVLTAVLPFRYAAIPIAIRKSCDVSMTVARLIWQICRSRPEDKNLLVQLFPIINEHLPQWDSLATSFMFASCAELMHVFDDENDDVLANFPLLPYSLARALQPHDLIQLDVGSTIHAVAIMAGSEYGVQKMIEWGLARHFPSLLAYVDEGLVVQRATLFVVHQMFSIDGSIELLHHFLSFEKTVFPHLIRFCVDQSLPFMEESLDLLVEAVASFDRSVGEYLLSNGILAAVEGGLCVVVEGDRSQEVTIRAKALELLEKILNLYSPRPHVVEEEEEGPAGDPVALKRFVVDCCPQLVVFVKRMAAEESDASLQAVAQHLCQTFL